MWRDRGFDLISRLRAEEILYMPFACVLEPALRKVSNHSDTNTVLSSLSEMTSVFTLYDVLQLTKEQFLSETSCGEDCLNKLLAAIKLLGFEETFPCQQS